MAPRVVAIDGAAGSGKSTLARGLATALRLPYVNTGAMYRALAALAAREGVPPHDEHGLVELIDRLRFTVRGGDPATLEVEGWTAASLATVEVESTVSDVARHPEVRRRLRDLQRGLGAAPGAVMEGRDIGTVVFPDAALKLFVTADPAVRAARRARERGLDPDAVASVAEALRERDDLDARTNPLVPAADAIEIDTTDRSVEQTVDAALAIVAARAPELLP